MRKAELRKVYLQKRAALTDTEVADRSVRICDIFFTHVDLSSKLVLHSFLTLDGRHEPNTSMILDRIRREFPNIRISLPRVNRTTNFLENIFFEGHDQLERSDWGIPEPRHGSATETKSIDIILVPLLAVDNRGHRVGYGKGFYDKFLADCRHDALRIGISLFDPIAIIDDVNEFDVPLHHCVTPTSFYSY